MAEGEFVERRFEFGRETVPVRFSLPVAVGADYRCDWVIGWPDGKRRFHAYGHDSLAALLLAVSMVKSSLINSDLYKSGRLTHLGDPDLQLPTFGEPVEGLGESCGAAAPTRYLNTDLDLFSTEDLTALAAGLAELGMTIHHVGEDSGSWRAHLEMNDCFETPEGTIGAMLNVVEALPHSLRESWTGCSRREFNMGFDCGDEPLRFERALPGDLIERIAAVSGGLGITLYAPERVRA